MDHQFRLLTGDEAVRRWQRLRLDVPVCLILEKPDKVHFLCARFKDVSQDGVAIFVGAELAIDSEVQLEFTPFSDRGPLRVGAVVRNRRGYVYGLEFLPKDAKEVAALQALKAILLPMGSEGIGSPDDRRWID